MKPKKLTGARLPIGLADLESSPSKLYLWGRMPALPWVALVGTRRPSAEAEAFCFELAGQLARSGVTVVSGGAVGIDAAAHHGALAVGEPTLVVAPSSYDRPYPAEHAELFQRVVAAGGGLMSAHAQETAARRHVFFARNAIMVACCAAVVMVEAPYRSGARNAAQWARRLGRLLFAVPHAPWNPKGRGCITELRLGAQPLVGYKDVLRQLRDRGFRNLDARSSLAEPGAVAERSAVAEPSAPAGAGTPGAPPQLPLWSAEGALRELEPKQGVLRLLETGPAQPFEQLLEHLGCSVPALQCALCELDLDRRVELGPDGYRLVRGA